MSKSHVITLRVPAELKARVTSAAKAQGVSVNQLTMYALAEKVTAIEATSYFDAITVRKSEAEIMAGFDEVMANVKKHPVSEQPEWDRMP